MRKSLVIAGLLSNLFLSGCIFDWSPDGRFLIKTDLRNESALTITDVNDRSTSEVPDSTKGSFPAWSPDGQHILFRKSPPDNTTYLYDVRERTTRKLDGGDEFPLFFAWTSSSRRFVTLTNPPEKPAPYHRPEVEKMAAPPKPPPPKHEPPIGRDQKFVWRCIANGEKTREMVYPGNIHLGTTQPILFLPGTEDIVFVDATLDGRVRNLYVTSGSNFKRSPRPAMLSRSRFQRIRKACCGRGWRTPVSANT